MGWGRGRHLNATLRVYFLWDYSIFQGKRPSLVFAWESCLFGVWGCSFIALGGWCLAPSCIFPALGSRVSANPFFRAHASSLASTGRFLDLSPLGSADWGCHSLSPPVTLSPGPGSAQSFTLVTSPSVSSPPPPPTPTLIFINFSHLLKTSLLVSSLLRVNTFPFFIVT